MLELLIVLILVLFNGFFAMSEMAVITSRKARLKQLAKESHYEVREDVFTRHDLYTADEVFLTGTAAEIVPVVKIDNRIIGSGKPGKTTQSLTKAFRQLTRKEGVKYSL